MNLYNPEEVQRIIHRLELLKPDAVRQWGQMTVSQMLAHCNVSLETAMGLNFPPRIFVGRLIGRLLKPKALNNKPMLKNGPTDKSYLISGDHVFENEKSRGILLINKFHEQGPAHCTSHPHPFFGKLTPQEWAILQWKHFDHHLRQFGA